MMRLKEALEQVMTEMNNFYSKMGDLDEMSLDELRVTEMANYSWLVNWARQAPNKPMVQREIDALLVDANAMGKKAKRPMLHSSQIGKISRKVNDAQILAALGRRGPPANMLDMEPYERLNRLARVSFLIAYRLAEGRK